MSIERIAGRYDEERDVPIGKKCALCKLWLGARSVRVEVDYGKQDLRALLRIRWVCPTCAGLIAEVAS